MTRKLIATKLHGAENDFLFVDASAGPALDTKALRQLAQRLCHRRRGLGADGLVLWDSSGGRVSMLIVNSDGSFAGTCGNALRCLGLLCLEHQIWDGLSPLAVHRLIPHVSGELAPDESFVTRKEIFAALSAGHSVALGRAVVSVVMGQEKYLAVDLPATESFLPHLERLFPSLFRPSYEKSTDVPCEAPFPLEHVRVDLSNPHWVFLSSAFSRFSEREFIAFGEAAQQDLRHADSTGSTPVCNIGMAWRSAESLVSDEHSPTFHLVVFERGAGLTPCCGSGATAARVALEALGAVSIDTDSVEFDMPGGVVSIAWTDDAPLFRVLSGGAERVAHLEISL